MSFSYKIIDKTIRKMGLKHHFDMSEEEFIKYIKENERPSSLPKFMYKHLKVSEKIIDGKPLFCLTYGASPSGGAILFIHGGGGMFSPTILHYRFAEKLAKATNSAVYFPFYPLAPEANADVSANWVSKVYDLIEQNHADKITVVGDSAGALIAARITASAKRKPRKLVLISPVTGTDKNDEAYMTAKKNDALLSEFVIEMSGKHWGKDIPHSSPRMNAEYIDYTDFPPILLYYGTAEMFAPHMDNLIENIKKRGVSLEVHAGEGMCHDWPLILSVPEGRAAFKRITAFLLE